jgi:hypothetical protein
VPGGPRLVLQTQKELRGRDLGLRPPEKVLIKQAADEGTLDLAAG